jgi:hypothetical protein
MSSSRHPRVRLALALLASAALLVAACGRRDAGGATTTVGTSGAPTSASGPETSATTSAPSTTAVATTTTLDVLATKTEIKLNWEKFFMPMLSIDDRVALLEHGETLRQAFVQRAADPLMQQANANVTAAELTSATTAAVTYDVFLNGTPALTGSQGIAVLEGGVWKVSAESFCALISLGATGPLPGCN